MSFSHTTFAQAKTQLLYLLGDLSGVHWLDVEAGLLIKEALSFWGLLTDASRARKTFPTVANQAIYDLGTLTQMDGMFARTYTDAELLTLIKYHLMESQASITAASSQFPYAGMLSVMQRSLNRWLGESEMRVTESSVTTSAPPVERVTLSDSILSILRVATLDADGNYLALVKESEGQANAYASDWELSPGVSEAYSIVMTPQLQLQLIPAFNNPLTLHLLSVNGGATLNPTGPVALGVQNDYAQFIKWLSLYSLLSKDGEGRSETRGDYALQRYLEGVKLTRLAPSVLQGAINGSNVEIESISDFDARDPEWQGTQGTPTRIALISNNLIALSPVPDGIYSVTLDVIGNMTLPASDGAYVQVSRDTLQALLQYALHLASFKEGAGKLLETKSSFDTLMEMASYENARLRANREDFESLRSQVKREMRENPISEMVEA